MSTRPAAHRRDDIRGSGNPIGKGHVGSDQDGSPAETAQLACEIRLTRARTDALLRLSSRGSRIPGEHADGLTLDVAIGLPCLLRDSRPSTATSVPVP